MVQSKWQINFGADSKIASNANLQDGGALSMAKVMFADGCYKDMRAGRMFNIHIGQPRGYQDATFIKGFVATMNTRSGNFNVSGVDSVLGSDSSDIFSITEYIQPKHSLGTNLTYSEHGLQGTMVPNIYSYFQTDIKNLKINVIKDQAFSGDLVFSTQKAVDFNINPINMDKNISNKYNINSLLSAINKDPKGAVKNFFYPLDILNADLSVTNWLLANNFDKLNGKTLGGKDKVLSRTNIGTSLGADISLYSTSEFSFTNFTTNLEFYLSNFEIVRDNVDDVQTIYLDGQVYTAIMNSSDSAVKTSRIDSNINTEKTIPYNINKNYYDCFGTSSIRNFNGWLLVQSINGRMISGYYKSTQADNKTVGGKIIPNSTKVFGIVSLTTQSYNWWDIKTELNFVSHTQVQNTWMDQYKFRHYFTNDVSLLDANKNIALIDQKNEGDAYLTSISIDQNNTQPVVTLKSGTEDNKFFVSSTNTTKKLGTITNKYLAVEFFSSSQIKTGISDSQFNNSSVSNLTDPVRAQLIVPTGKTIADITNYPYKNSLLDGSQVVALVNANNYAEVNLKSLGSISNSEYFIRIALYDSLTDSTPKYLSSLTHIEYIDIV